MESVKIIRSRAEYADLKVSLVNLGILALILGTTAGVAGTDLYDQMSDALHQERVARGHKDTGFPPLNESDVQNEITGTFDTDKIEHLVEQYLNGE